MKAFPAIVVIALLTFGPGSLSAQEASENEPTDVRLIQPETILITFIDIHHYSTIRDLQEQMYAIPGVTDFIPQLETRGLLSYKLRYSGHAKLLMKALEETIGEKYELGMKDMGEKAWEITVRKL